MMLPEPTFSFTIPSIHDDIPLDCRIYHPHRQPSGEANDAIPLRPRGAIVAHPYTTLGGSYDDYVVLLAVAEILKAGFVAGTFNFRGAGSSKGRSSWTGKPELLDYISFIGLFVHYLDSLRLPNSNSVAQNPTLTSDPSTHTTAFPYVTTNPPGITLVLGGYSYGSLLTSHLPPVPTLLDRFANPSAETAEARIKAQALDLAVQWNQSATTHLHSEAQCPRNARVHETHGSSPPPSGLLSMGGEVPSHESHRTSVDSGKSFRRGLEYSRKKLSFRKSSDRCQTRSSAAAAESASSLHNNIKLSQIGYLLISPLLPPISLLVTMFSKLDSHHHDLCKTNATSPPQSISPRDSLNHSENILVNHPTLAIYGTKDFFGSQRKLRQWAENLASQQKSLFQFREIGGAGHFWQESGVDKELRCAIREWLQDIEGLQEDGLRQGTMRT